MLMELPQIALSGWSIQLLSVHFHWSRHKDTSYPELVRRYKIPLLQYPAVHSWLTQGYKSSFGFRISTRVYCLCSAALRSISLHQIFSGTYMLLSFCCCCVLPCLSHLACVLSRPHRTTGMHFSSLCFWSGWPHVCFCAWQEAIKDF